MPSNILVIGSSNLDLIVRLPHLPTVGQTVTDGRFYQANGGKGANQAVAAARAGGNVTFLTAVGKDDAGSAMLESFKRDGMDMNHVIVASDTHTGTALIMFDKRGDNYLAVAPGANDRVTATHIDAAENLIRNAAMIVMQMELPAAATQRALEVAKQSNIPVLFNFAPARLGEVHVTDAMTGLVVNENEASELTGKPVTNAAEAQVAAAILRARGPRFVLVTLGAQGVCGIDENGAFQEGAIPAKAVDTTAAGDTFCGALAVALVEKSPLRDAIRFASAAAAISVTRIGAQPSIPTRREIDAMLKR